MRYEIGDTIKIDLELNRNLFEEYELVCPFVKVWASYDSRHNLMVYAYANFYNLRTHEISSRIPHFFDPLHSTLVPRTEENVVESLADATLSATAALRGFGNDAIMSVMLDSGDDLPALG